MREDVCELKDREEWVWVCVTVDNSGRIDIINCEGTKRYRVCWCCTASRAARGFIFLRLVTMEVLPRRLLPGCDSAFFASNRRAHTSSTDGPNMSTHVFQKDRERSIYRLFCSKTSTVQNTTEFSSCAIYSIQLGLGRRKQSDLDIVAWRISEMIYEV